MMHQEGRLSLLFIIILNSIYIYGNQELKVSTIDLPADAYVSKRYDFSAQKTSFCAYVKFPTLATIDGVNKTLFVLSGMKTNYTLTVMYRGQGSVVLEENGRQIDEDFFEHTERFNKLCVTSGRISVPGRKNERLWINHARFLHYPISKLTPSNATAEDTEMEFTVGGPTPHTGAPSFNLTIAGLAITHEVAESFEKYFNYNFYKDDSAKLQKGLTYTDFSEWPNKRSSIITNLSFFELFTSGDCIIPLDGKTYDDPNIACSQFNGRPIGRDEIINHGNFLHKLIEEKTQVAEEENKNLIWIEKCQIFDVKTKQTHIACAPPNDPWTLCIYNEWEIFSFRRVALDSTPATAGSLFYRVKNLHFIVAYEYKVNSTIKYLKFCTNCCKVSQITFSDDKWRLTIASTSDVWFFNEKKLPVGKKTWNLEKKNMKEELTLSSCDKYYHHACHNGQCVFTSLKCNGEEDCADGSDELHCPSGTNMYRNGYMDKGNLQIDHEVQISNIGEVKFSDRSLKINLDMTLSWLDERFIFRANIGTTTYDCSYLPWHAKLQIFSSCDTEIRVDSAIVKYICFAKFKDVMKYESRGYDYANPKNDSKVNQKFKIQLELPCRFDFGLFPFAFQACNFCIGIQNDDNKTEYKFINQTTPKINYSSSSINNLGDFKLESLTRVVIKNATQISFSIELSSPFNYYIVAGYLPSILILLVSYATLFFRLDLFSERIGVSLTALLTMVFLFVETSSSVIKTSYMKYLDIWFLSTMTFSVGLVLFNSLLHYTFWKREEVESFKKMKALLGEGDIQEKSCPEREPELKMDMIWGPDNSQRKLNRGGRVAFPFVFLIFCLSYVARASN